MSLFLRNLFFTLLQPGIVAGLIPWLIVRRRGDPVTEFAMGWMQWVGLTTGVVGGLLALYCIYLFAAEGRGTLSPADPTTQLVAKGIYRYSRNPMYIGVLMVLAGEALYTGYHILWLYTGIIFLIFHLFIIYFEEPRLRKDFGDSYEQYCKVVKRWV